MKSYITTVWEVTAEEADEDTGIVHSTTRRFSQEYDAHEMVRVYEGRHRCSIRELEVIDHVRASWERIGGQNFLVLSEDRRVVRRWMITDAKGGILLYSVILRCKALGIEEGGQSEADALLELCVKAEEAASKILYVDRLPLPVSEG